MMPLIVHVNTPRLAVRLFRFLQKLIPAAPPDYVLARHFPTPSPLISAHCTSDSISFGLWSSPLPRQTFPSSTRVRFTPAYLYGRVRSHANCYNCSLFSSPDECATSSATSEKPPKSIARPCQLYKSLRYLIYPRGFCKRARGTLSLRKSLESGGLRHSRHVSSGPGVAPRH